MHGLLSVQLNGAPYHLETRYGVRHGKGALYHSDGRIYNHIDDMDNTILSAYVDAENAYYNYDGTVGTAIDVNWYDYV